MLLNILMYIWILCYSAAGYIVLYQMYKGTYMTWREMGFFVFGTMFAGVPFYWLINTI